MTIQSRVTRFLVQFVNEMEDHNDRYECGNWVPLLPRCSLGVPLSFPEEREGDDQACHALGNCCCGAPVVVSF